MKKDDRKWKFKKSFLKVKHNLYYNPFAKKEEHYSVITFSKDGFGIIVAITSENKIVLIKQYRVGAGKFILNLPSGAFKEEGTLSQKIKKMKEELEEETGYSAKISNFKKIGEVFLTPARITDKCTIFVAKNVYKTKGGRKLESAEKGSQVIVKDLQEVIKMINSGKIEALSSIAAILLAKEKGFI